MTRPTAHRAPATRPTFARCRAALALVGLTLGGAALAGPRAVVHEDDGGQRPAVGADWAEDARAAAQDVVIVETDLAANGISAEEAVLVQLGANEGDGPRWLVLQGEDRRWRARRDGCQERAGLPERSAPRALRVAPVSLAVARSPELLLGERSDGEQLAIAHLRPGDTLTRIHVAKKGRPASEHLELVQGSLSLSLTQVGTEARLCGGPTVTQR